MRATGDAGGRRAPWRKLWGLRFCASPRARYGPPVHELTAYALTLLLAVARPPAVDIEVERPRLEAMARDVASAVVEADEIAAWLPGSGDGPDATLPLPFAGPDARRKTVAALVAIAYGESRLSAAVADCRRVGSDHPSLGSWQLHGRMALGPYARATICSSPRRGAERALWVLSYHAARCGSIRKAFRGYASGDCGVKSDAAEAHYRRWERLVRAGR